MNPALPASPRPPAARPWRLRHAFALLLAVVLMAVMWMLVATLRESEASPFALLMAIACAWTLHLWRAPPRWARAWVAAFGTLIGIGLARWWIAAANIGESLGLYPYESVMRMGAWFATYLNLRALSARDYLWFVVACGLAAWLARPRSR